MGSTGRILFLLSYVASAVLCMAINMIIRGLDGQDILQNEVAKDRIIQLTYVKIGIIIFRVFFLSRSLGGASISNALNLIVLFVLTSSSNITAIQNVINMVLPDLTLSLNREIKLINDFDFWVSTLGFANSIVSVPYPVNWILVIAIVYDTFFNQDPVLPEVNPEDLPPIGS